MLQVFQELLPPKQRVLAAKAREIGSDAVLEDEQLVKELLAVESTPNSSPGPEGQPGGDRPPGLDELRKEIKRDPDEVIKMNSEFFNLKYGIQKREIETMARLITRDGDRVIEAITAGPHDRIVDPVRRDVFHLHLPPPHTLPSGYIQCLEVYGEWLLSNYPKTLSEQHAGMAWKRRDTPIRYSVEGLLRREGFQGLGFHHGSGQLGTQVHQSWSYAEHSRGIRRRRQRVCDC